MLQIGTVNSEISRIFASLKIRLGHDLPTSVNDRVILPFRKGLIFMKLRANKVSRKQKTLRKFPNLQFYKSTL